MTIPLKYKSALVPDSRPSAPSRHRSGSGRNLEWYTWHLWKRLLTTELGLAGQQAPQLESAMPVDYTPPRGISDEPADYRALYIRRKAEVEKRSAAARERIAAANQLAQELKDSHKAKMIDKLAPSKRGRGSGTSGFASSGAGAGSAYLHKPRPDSRSSLLSKPGAQLKLLKDLGLVKPPAASKPATTVRTIRPAPVSAAATGHSSNLAGAHLLSRATGGQLGKPAGGAAGSGRQQGALADAVPSSQASSARAAAVAAAAAARSAATQAGTKRSASGAAHSPPPSKVGRTQGGTSHGSQGGGDSRGGAASGMGLGSEAAGGPPRPDPRVMFPRQAPPQSSPGQSKFSMPTARPMSTCQSFQGAGAQERQRAAAAAERAAARQAAAAGGRGLRPAEDL
ncbi:hypothetical protein GPECTOR_61g814 [Gonium pectorale]|uniref:Uncharacterized protein n=1 Tax=Gonium pectorale TaxID=33097 RepID=A0A150G4W2_GONPE|nr:hypothetical protein GPECTOR_61g814 [Gonium pectorale]|eukprot:KXZ44861.1 hypothetical protein GPECTOR_61g814 [Gonium pectorale]